MKIKFKDICQFLILPVTIISASMISMIAFVFFNSFGLSFVKLISLITYIFLGGVLFSKIENIKIKISSAIITSILLLCYFVFTLIDSNDTSVLSSLFIYPLAYSLEALFPKFITDNDILHDCVLTVFSVLPVAIIIISSKIFTLKKKSIKVIMIIILTVICIFVLSDSIKSAVEQSNDTYFDGFNVNRYYYDVNGNKYQDNSEVPYYDVDKKVYYWKYDDSKADDMFYCGYFEDELGNEYDINNIYVNSDGYIYIDKNEEMQLRDDLPDDEDTDWCYKDEDGNIYTSILGIDYLDDGTPFTGMGDEYRTK